jgi:hypothetical protein
MSKKLCAICVAAGGALALTAAASATLTDPFIFVRATNAQGTGTFAVPLGDTMPGPNGSTVFSLGAPVDIMSGPNVIATLTQLNSTVRPLAGAQPNTITLSFTFFAGDSDTTFEVLSTTFTFDPIMNQSARATAGMTITDSNGNGASSTGTIANGAHYQARYDSNTFANLLNGPLAAGAGGSNTASDRSPINGFSPLASDATSMSAAWGFTLSANDQIGVTSSFFLVPAPGALALLGLGGITMVRRNRR